MGRTLRTIKNCLLSTNFYKSKQQTFGWSGGKASNGEPGTGHIGTVIFIFTSPDVVNFTQCNIR